MVKKAGPSNKPNPPLHPWRLCPYGEHWVREEIANRHFSKLKKRPCPVPSKFGVLGSKYDDFITGWTQYWNEVLKPDVPLEPNLVKALIASESSFDPMKLANKKNSNSARGLTQITNDTRKLLNGSKGGLKDHFVAVTNTKGQIRIY